MIINPPPDDPTPSYRTGEAGFVSGKAEYHVRWGVRRYDLTNVRDDLDHCVESGRAFIIWASVLLGMGGTLLVAWAVAMSTSPPPHLWLRELLGFGALIFVVLGIAFVLLDRRFTVTSSADLSYVKGKVDNLISMFDKENP